MKIYFGKEDLTAPISYQQIENKPPHFHPEDRLIGGGDEDSWIDYLFEKIEAFFTSIINFFSQLFESDDLTSSDVGDKKTYNKDDIIITKIDPFNKATWSINISKISLIAEQVNLPKECETVSLNKMIKTLSVGLDKNQASVLNEKLESGLFSLELMKYLKSIAYKAKDLPDNEKMGISLRLYDAFTECIPTWTRVAKRISDELYLGKNTPEANKILFQLIEEYKSDLLNKIFERLGKNNHFHWNIQDLVRNKYGMELGLDQSISKDDTVYSSILAGYFANEIRNEFLRVYRTDKNVQDLVTYIQQRIITQNLNFFDYLVQIIELKDNIGNLEAKKYVQDNLFESEDLMNFKIKEEAVYLLLHAIGVVK